MNNTFSLQQKSQTGTLDSNLIPRQYKRDLMVSFMEIKSFNPILRQDQIAKHLGWSNSTLQRYRHHLIMHSPYRNLLNSNKRERKISNCEQNLERPQLTSNDLKKPQFTSKESTNENVKSLQSKNKNCSKAGSIHKNKEINGVHLDENLHQNKLNNGTSNVIYY